VNCPLCGHANSSGALRCEACDEWLDGHGKPGAAPERGARTSSGTQQFAAPPTAEPAEPEEAPARGGTQPLASRTLEALKCPGCHREVGEEWRFCKSCGSPLGAARRAAPTEPGAPLTAASAARHVLVQLAADGSTVRTTHELRPGRTVVGRSEGDVQVGGDAAMSSRHACFEVRGRRCVLRDLDSTNGTFVALTRGEPLEPGAVLLAGSQRLLLRVSRTDDGRRREELVQVLPLGHSGRVLEIDKDSVVVGKGQRADFAFPDDHYLSRRHAEIVRTSRGLVVRDLGSTNRTYLIVSPERALEDGDRIVLGEHLFEYRLEERPSR
jgi:pSer/pThr/pTyr-binding forkhead associated (FHA) protein